MNGTQKIGVGVVVLGLLGVGVWSQMKKDQAIGVSKDKPAELPEIKGSDDLDKIVITNGEKGEVTLEKKGDKWMVTKPVVAPANQGNVKSLLDNLKELKVTEQVESQLTDTNKKAYQLEDGKGVHVVAFKGADKKVDDVFGKTGQRGQMMMKTGTPGVYAATGYSGYLYGREVKAWRDTEIFKFDDANASQVTIEKKDDTLSFTKDKDKWAGTSKGKPIARFDDGKVKELLGNFKALAAEDFGDGKSAADTGLDAPESTVTITLKDNAGKYTLKVGKSSGGSLRYAMKDGDPTIFVISGNAAEWSTAEASKFQRPLDAGAPKDAGPQMGMPPGMGMPGMMPPGMMGMPPGMGGMPPGHPDTH
ncbi:MAG: hypothetical protein JWM74_5282 [Myxococcaceae bacterium]|nr:hypothetical protein [Myxococcaceae bacterium]